MPASNVQRDKQLLEWHRAGYSYRKIATEVMAQAKLTPVSVSAVKKACERALSREKGIAETSPVTAGGDPLTYEQLDPEQQAMLELTADGFELFFNKYSGLELQPIHKEWVTDALSHTLTLINVPPRHAKSTIFSVWFPLWLCCGAGRTAALRDVQILLVSQTNSLSRKFGQQIAWNLEHNVELIRDFGRFKPQNSDWPWRPLSCELMIEGRERGVKSGDMTIQGRGQGQQLLGLESDWVILDDITNRMISMSEKMREDLGSWLHGDALTRMEPNARALCIGQRVTANDIYAELAGEKDPEDPDKNVWFHINYPAILDWEKQETLWPNKWDFQAMVKTQRTVGTDLFSAMYQQNPLAQGQRLAPDAWLYGDEASPGCVDKTRGAGPMILPEGWARVLSIDPSPTRYAGLIVADVNKRQDAPMFEARILEIVRDRMAVRDIVSNVERVLDAYRPDYFIFEQNAAQRWFFSDPAMDGIRRRVRVMPHTTSSNKGDPVLGVQSLSPVFEFGNFHFPYGDADSRYQTELAFTEVRTYPEGLTDDLLMALWFIKFKAPSLVAREGREAKAWKRPSWKLRGSFSH